MPLPATAEHGHHAPNYHRHRHLITIAKPKIKSPYREATLPAQLNPSITSYFMIQPDLATSFY